MPPRMFVGQNSSNRALTNARDYYQERLHSMNRILNHTALPLGCAAIMAWTAAPTAFAKEQVPFKGYWNTVHHDTSSFDPVLGPIIAVEVEGEGKSSYLGLARCFSDDQIAFLATGVILASYTYTAANGDRLLLQTASQLVGFDPVTQTVSFIGNFDIVGGTGRFEGATGAGETSGWALFEQPFGSPVNSGPGFFAFEGVISTMGAATE